ncbi:MAG: hypothetical protein H6819_00735 [Phycisphaerales bacterium]|nr:hypothetical protein [Phycisphaerales bacterium]MCB9857266.1 hypothetical protein [Phycisphaerales bacterium]
MPGFHIGNSVRTLAISLAFTLVITNFAASGVIADDNSAAISQALDQVIDSFQTSELPVADALTEIGRAAGVTIDADPAALDLLPWGKNTKLKGINVRAASLRTVLPQILEPLGLEYTIGEEAVLVTASEPLKRINRRATWNDLKTLQRCISTEYTPEALNDFVIRYRITSKVDAPALLNEQLAKSAGGTVAMVLEDAAAAIGWVWFPNEDHIVIRTVQAQTANYMSRRVTVQYTNEPLADILLDLANRAETPINFEPGMMLKLPSETARHTSLALRNNSIRQGFELLSAHTGIRYSIQRGGINVSLSDVIQRGSSTSLPISLRSPYVGKITVPGPDKSYAFDILLREDDLPQDILDYRKAIIDEYIEKMRAEMQAVESE